jgi:S-adenosylmethionine:tRNA ribosyltransferase-isomerase
LKTLDFDYDLPRELIAQTPIEPRDSSRLMVIKRNTGKVFAHRIFRDLGGYLDPGDLLVLNETRVIPARLKGKKIPTGGRVEILLLRRIETQVWECLVGGKGLVTGKEIQLGNKVKASIIELLGESRRIVRFSSPLSQHLSDIGEMPLPPYIHEKLAKPERYQTVYATTSGSAAAPTAGLHFTPTLIAQLRDQGVNFTSVTLHVGLDTFAPVNEDDPLNHKIHTEWCEVNSQTVELINQTKEKGYRVIAVGTTSVRALETTVSDEIRSGSKVEKYTGPTNLFILPGYEFKIIDGIITNFHLPRSSLIMMISAFVGRENILNAYESAKSERYRFYSFGDAMIIL